MDPFVAEIRMFPYTFPPKAWAFCDGQLLPLSQNTALFALLGTVYGGDGKSTFALPDLQGSVPMHPGQGQGLSLRQLGQLGGAETITLLQSEMPVHTHAMNASQSDALVRTPEAELPALMQGVGGYAPPGATVQMNPVTWGVAGGSLPHNNLQPYLVVNFCIALQGVFPVRP